MVKNVMVAVPPLALTEAGLVLPNEHTAWSPLNVTFELTLHESETVPVYPYAEFTVTAACDVAPGLMEAGLAVPAESE
jgi:hypothetical protein